MQPVDPGVEVAAAAGLVSEMPPRLGQLRRRRRSRRGRQHRARFRADEPDVLDVERGQRGGEVLPQDRTQVDGLWPSRRAISRTPAPWARHSAMSSRSAEQEVAARDRRGPDPGSRPQRCGTTGTPPVTTRRPQPRRPRSRSRARSRPRTWDTVLTPRRRRTPRRRNLTPIQLHRPLSPAHSHATPPRSRCCDDQLSPPSTHPLRSPSGWPSPGSTPRSGRSSTPLTTLW